MVLLRGTFRPGLVGWAVGAETLVVTAMQPEEEVAMTPTSQAVAERLVAALQSEDPRLLWPLLGPDVRWGGLQETKQTCRSRGDVLVWYQQLHDAGVRAQVTETLVREQAVMLTMALTGVENGPDGPRPDVVHQVFHLDAGLVVDIRGYPQRELALAWADTPTTRN
jgi:hypothetical protein